MAPPEKSREQCPLPQNTSAELDTLRERSFLKNRNQRTYYWKY